MVICDVKLKKKGLVISVPEIRYLKGSTKSIRVRDVRAEIGDTRGN